MFKLRRRIKHASYDVERWAKNAAYEAKTKLKEVSAKNENWRRRISGGPKLFTLPVEVLEQIFKWLPLNKVRGHLRVCRAFHEILDSQSFAVLHLSHFQLSSFAFPRSVEDKTVIDESGKDRDAIKALPVGWFKWPSSHQAAYVNAELEAVVELRCFGMGVVGVVPLALGDNMLNLEVIDLASNRLRCSGLANLSKLGKLRELDLGENYLWTTIPKEFGDLINLRKLRLRESRIMGSIPSELGKLAYLEVLDLRDNYLEGGIPAELGKLGRLRILNLDHCGLGGSIPKELGDMTSLETCLLSSNRLTGTIPEEICNLPNLKFLSVASNLGLIRNDITLTLEAKRKEGLTFL